MPTVYIEVNWQGPGYYRAVRSYRVNETSYMSVHKFCNLEDEERAERERLKGWKMFRAEFEHHLPKVKET